MTADVVMSAKSVSVHWLVLIATLVVTPAPGFAFDDAKYPDWKGQAPPDLRYFNPTRN